MDKAKHVTAPPQEIATLPERARLRACSRQRATLLRLLNEALATRVVNMLRNRRHYHLASASVPDAVRGVFLVHAAQHLADADRIAGRIMQLQGEPDFNPRGLTGRSHAEYATADNLECMIREDLVAARIAIDSDRQIIEYIGSGDPATRRLMEDMLAGEEQRAAALVRLLRATRPVRQAARA